MSKNIRRSAMSVYKTTLRIAESVLEGINSPRSLAVAILMRHYLSDRYSPSEFDNELKSLGFSPQWYDQFSIEQFRDDYQATVLLTKLPSPVKNDELRNAALESFFASELRNASFNDKWSGNYSQAHKELEKLGVPVEKVTGILRSLLGRAPSLQALADDGEWTTGSSASMNRETASRVEKSINGITCTYRLAQALQHVDLQHVWRLPEKAWLLIPGNLVDTVPKNITTDRTIAKCPDINSFFQRATGVKIARRLLKVGIDLSRQENNQYACMTAYSHHRATIDLRNASNSVMLFAALRTFPDDWADLFEILRSPYGTTSSRKSVIRDRDAGWFEYHMLSSMGNGFTFEVETALFYAICLACGCSPGETWVYGDDIIIPQDRVSLVVQVLAIYGLEVNLEKSFTSGAFFESCGTYSFFGVDVTPFKIKDLLYEAKDTLVLANKIRMFAHNCRYLNGCDKRFLPAWQMCVRWLPDDERRRCRGPALSGLTLFCNRNEVRMEINTSKSAKKSPFGYPYTYQLVPRLIERHTAHVKGFYYRLSEVKGSYTSLPLASWLRQFQHESLSAKGCVAKQYSVGYNISKLYIQSWYDMGRWS